MESGKAYWQNDHWVIYQDQQQNLERVSTLNNGSISGVPVHYELVDPRRARPKQRALFFALLGDIHSWSGEPTDWLKEYFYTRYTIRTAGEEISLANDTGNTVSDATKLIEDVIDFIFEFSVPVNEAYPLLPKDENYFQYECIKHRQCLVCGRHGDIHHVEGIYGNTVGMGGNRNHVDHSKRVLACLCRKHHEICHKYGTDKFCATFGFTHLGIKVDAQTLKRIGVQGHYETNGTAD